MGQALRRIVTTASVVGLATATVVVTSTGAGAASRGHIAGGEAAPQLILGHKFAAAGGPPTSTQCIAQYGIACYTPSDIRHQYDFTPAYAAGDSGTGQTIVIFDSYGDPTIRTDLATFDAAYGIPAPPSFNIYEPEGHVTYDYLRASPSAIAHNKNMQTEITWGYEVTLDVEWSHAMAPGANIALVVTPNAETQGVQGLQNLQNTQQWVLDHHIGTIWSDSWATTEQAFHSAAVIQRLDRFYAQAASDGVSAFFATGDTGVANTDKQGTGYPYPTVNYPSSSPNVVSIGGTEIPTPEPAIVTHQPEAVWNDGFGAGGGGYSSVFPEPAYQSTSVAPVPDPSGMRGLPDVSYNAALVSSILIYESFDPRSAPSWLPIGGTSAATPQWAAIDAIANQADGPLGFLTPRLYQVYDSPTYTNAFHDIVTGTNSFNGVKGYSAAPGWDAASGLGTPDVANLVKALAKTAPTPT